MRTVIKAPAEWVYPECSNGPADWHIQSGFAIEPKPDRPGFYVTHCVDCDWFRLTAVGYGTLEGFGMPMSRFHSEAEQRAFFKPLMKLPPAFFRRRSTVTPK